LYDAWQHSTSREIGRLGDDGSDHAVFVQHLGVPGADAITGLAVAWIGLRSLGEIRVYYCSPSFCSASPSPAHRLGSFLLAVSATGVMHGFNPDQYPMYHSVLDDYQWMALFGDPEFKR